MGRMQHGGRLVLSAMSACRISKSPCLEENQSRTKKLELLEVGRKRKVERRLGRLRRPGLGGERTGRRFIRRQSQSGLGAMLGGCPGIRNESKGWGAPPQANPRIS